MAITADQIKATLRRKCSRCGAQPWHPCIRKGTVRGIILHHARLEAAGVIKPTTRPYPRNRDWFFIYADRLTGTGVRL
jgi:hypothetical protein